MNKQALTSDDFVNATAGKAGPISIKPNKTEHVNKVSQLKYRPDGTYSVITKAQIDRLISDVSFQDISNDEVAKLAASMDQMWVNGNKVVVERLAEIVAGTRVLPVLPQKPIGPSCTRIFIHSFL